MRIRYLDALRGFSMLLVVLGHIMYRMGFTDDNSILFGIIASFRRPLFFFVSGLFAYRAMSVWNSHLLKDVMTRKVLAQIFCPILFYALWAYTTGVNVLGWLSGGWGGYWFTIVLFQMYLIYLVLMGLARWMGSGKWMDIGMVVLSVIFLAVLILHKGTLEHCKMLHLISLSKYFQFYAMGVLIRKHWNSVVALFTKESVIALSVALYVVFLILYFDKSFESASPRCFHAVHDIFVRYAGLLTVFIFFFKNKEYFNGDSFVTRSLSLIGQRTLDIYMIHYFLLPDLSFLTAFLSNGTQIVLQLFVLGLVTLLVIAICLLVSQVLRSSKYISYFLFGVRMK